MAGYNWAAFQSNVFSESIKASERLLHSSGPVEATQQNRSAASDVLKEAKAEADEALGSGTLDEKSKALYTAASAVLSVRRGLVLLEADQAEGESAILSGAEVLERNPYRYITLLQDAFNNLGILRSEQKDYQRSLELLHKAEKLYKTWLGSIPAQHLESLSMTDYNPQPKGDSRPQATGEAEKEIPPPQVQRLALDKYAHTLFYLAQIYNIVDDSRNSAFYCAGTLTHQLELGIHDHVEWAENCQQLANYHLGNNEIGVVEHLLKCSTAALSRCTKDASSSVEGGFPLVQANIAQLWGKLYSKRLALSVKAQGEHPEVFQPQTTDLKENLRFQGLVDWEVGKLNWNGGLAKSMTQAKDLFNAGILNFKKALDYFTLEGHVTMHYNLVLEVSELYRWLADMEEDRHKKCILHKARAKRVKQLLKQLNATVWPDLYRTLQLDIGNAYREITEIKFEDRRPHEKVAAAAAQCMPYYEAYVDHYKRGGSLPNKMDDLEEAEAYVKAVFYLARVISRLDPPVTDGNYSQTQNLRRSVALYQYCAEFIKRNKLEGQNQLANTCVEMAKLIIENAEMMKVSAARKDRMNPDK